ncbi:MAG: hypothetical protein MI922_30495, partial [Bacteroidales bacterium]|nr:hypothetical protein [Bacteroidales bacterium]
NRPSTRTVTTTRTTTTRTTSAHSGRSSHHSPSRSTRNTSYRAVAVSANRPTRAVSRSYRYHSHHEYRPLPKQRTVHVHHYRPVEVVYHFTPKVRVRYCNIYPHIDFSVYPSNYRIPTISAYKARYYKGSLASVYGVVRDVHYSRDYDEYYLYVGQYYPRHDFCVVMPGYLAREYSRHPGSYFRDYEVMVTGQISHYSGKPEMVIKTHSQLDVFQFHAYADHDRYYY